MVVKIKDGRSCFYQWDTSQTLVVEHNQEIYGIHFSHKNDNTALVVEPKEINGTIEASVPNILLQSAGDIFVYLVYKNQDGAETRKSVRFPVIARPRPEAYVYTETEVLNYYSLSDRVDQIEKNGVSDEQIAIAVEKYLDENPAGVNFETDGTTLILKDGILSVNTTNQMEQDNTQPITSAGVYATVGNIEALLKTI